jgi:hypothetical protein
MRQLLVALLYKEESIRNHRYCFSFSVMIQAVRNFSIKVPISN